MPSLFGRWCPITTQVEKKGKNRRTEKKERKKRNSSTDNASTKMKRMKQPTRQGMTRDVILSDKYGGLHQKSWTPNPVYATLKGHIPEQNPKRLLKNTFKCPNLGANPPKTTQLVFPRLRVIGAFSS